MARSAALQLPQPFSPNEAAIREARPGSFRTALWQVRPHDWWTEHARQLPAA